MTVNEPPIEKPKKCGWWRGHTWGSWHIVRRGSITRKDDSVVGENIMQERECSTCGFTQIHVEKVWLV